jgi:multiple sugar transport system permease protein
MRTQFRSLDPRTVERLIKIGSVTVLLVGAIFMIFPFVWMVSTSLKQEQYLVQFPPQIIPDPVNWKNYIDVWSKVPLLQGFFNSLFVSVTGTIGVLMASSLAGFAFAKLDFPGRERIFIILLITLMIPGAVLLIPQFLMFRSLKWVNTFNPLIIPSLFGAIYETFFFRQYFRTLPNDLIDAAKIDGASFLTIFLRVAVPLARPVFASLGVLAFMFRWNDYTGPLIYLQDPKMQTLPVMISTFQGQYITAYGLMMAISVLSILPILILFIFLQRYFVQGITLSGIKG